MRDVLTMLEWLNACEAAVEQMIDQMPPQPAQHHNISEQRQGYALRLGAQKLLARAREANNGTDFLDYPEMLAPFPDPLDLQNLLTAIEPAQCSGTTLNVLASDTSRLIDDWLRLPTRMLTAFRGRGDEYDEAVAEEAARPIRKQRKRDGDDEFSGGAAQTGLERAAREHGAPHRLDRTTARAYAGTATGGASCRVERRQCNHGHAAA
jgi:hypothetical protein